ncbi:MAG: hypothetical protein J4F49_10155 [Rhodobacteraceae bacterium]|nr:hypothetical protein [Paracoccaceae bacterium]
MSQLTVNGGIKLVVARLPNFRCRRTNAGMPVRIRACHTGWLTAFLA